MPVISAAVAGFVGTLGVGAAASAAIGTFVTSLLTTTALSIISSAILPKPGRPDLSALSGRQEMIRQPIVARRTIYGRALVSGPLVYAESYGSKNGRLSLVIPLAGHECEAFEKFYFDDEEVEFDTDGFITTEKYVKNGNPMAMLFSHLGADDQAADAELVSQSDGKWTSAHRLRGVAYIHVVFFYDPDVYPNGAPNVRVLVKGKKVEDPRSSTTAWSDNVALCARDYLKTKLGLEDDEFDDTLFSAAANVCDENVLLNLPTGGSESRYTINGTVDDDHAPQDVIDAMMGAMAGTLTHIGGLWELFAGAAGTATITLDEDDLAGPVEVIPRLSRREICNAIKPVYVDSTKDWQPVMAPPIENATYVEQDGGVKIWKTIEYPFTTSSATAQRLGKIELERTRQQITVKATFKPNALRVKPWDVIALTLEHYGFAGKLFRVVGWSLNPDMSVAMTLREEAASMWSWSAEETVVDPAPDTNLPDPFTVSAPGGIAVTDNLAVTASGAVATTLNVVVTEVEDAFVIRYELQFKKSADSEWIGAGEQESTRFAITNVEDGTAYDIRARAINTIGRRSDWTTVTYVPVGQTARPADVDNFAVNIIGEEAHLTWDAVTDVDLSHYRVRFSTATSGATWESSFDLVLKVARPATSVTVPAMVGTYLVKAVDLKGLESENEALTVSTISGVAGLNVVETVTESPSFAGSKTDVVINGDGNLVLGGGGVLWDSLVGNWDDLDGQWDGIGGVADSGTYLFANSVDLGAVYTSRVTAAITVQTAEYAVTWDDLTSNWDSLDGNWDDLSGARDVRAKLQVRTTEDDPSGTPTWSGWRDFVVGDYKARGIEFRLMLSSDSDDASPEVTALSVTVDMPDRIIAGNDLAIDAAGEAISFSPAFKALQGIGIAAQDLATGDYWTITSKSATGFTIRFFNASDVGVARTMDYLAKGYGVAA